jgi:phosphatidylglycerophosphatase C
VEVLSTEGVIERIGRARGETPGGGGAVAFDGDGTLWSGDVGEDYFYAVVATGRFLPPAIEAMRALAQAAGLGGFGTGHDAGVALAQALFAAYLDHKVSEETICEVIAWTCAGWREDDVRQLALDTLVRGRLASRRYEEVERVVRWARASGLETFVVSASPRPIVEAATESLGFDRAHVIAATPLFDAGVMLADVSRPIPYGPGKATLLASALGRAPLVAAFGDNVFDLPMLEAARVAVVVEPKERLLGALAAGEGRFREGPYRLRVG